MSHPLSDEHLGADPVGPVCSVCMDQITRLLNPITGAMRLPTRASDWIDDDRNLHATWQRSMLVPRVRSPVSHRGPVAQKPAARQGATREHIGNVQARSHAAGRMQQEF